MRMMSRLGFGVILAGALGALATAFAQPLFWPSFPAAAAQSEAVQPLRSPAPEGSAQPQLTVSSRGVLLSWIERQGTQATLAFAERTADGWSQPRVVASGDDWFVNWADVPSVLRMSNGVLWAHWLQKSGAGTYAYDVRLARSTDDGRTWSRAVTPHHDGTQTEHGFASLYELPGAQLGLIWLDGRAMASEGASAGERGHSSTGHAQGAGEGAMSLRSAVFDASGRQVAETAVDLRVCECCPTAAAVASAGPVIAYRDRSEDEVRDIYVARLVDGAWTAGRPAHRDNWRIAACPVNGPALDAAGSRVAIAWFTAADDEGRAFAAFSTDSGATFGPPIRLDETSALGRVDIVLLDDGSAVAAWIEFAQQRARLMMRRIDAFGRRSSAIPVAALAASRASGYPRLARDGNALLLAWTDPGPPSRVMTATASPPALPDTAR